MGVAEPLCGGTGEFDALRLVGVDAPLMREGLVNGDLCDPFDLGEAVTQEAVRLGEAPTWSAQRQEGCAGGERRTFDEATTTGELG